MIQVKKAPKRLKYKGISTQLTLALNKVFSPQDVDNLGFGEDIETEEHYIWNIEHKKNDFKLVYNKRTGIITFGREEEEI